MHFLPGIFYYHQFRLFVMSSKKFSNPWMPASNGVFGGGGAYNKNTYNVRGKGAANNPWVQGSGWWKNIVEGSFQQGFR